MTHKRRRLALSCTICRSRKLKCGREHPQCSRCVKAGKAEQCLYVPYTDVEKSGGLPTPESPENARRRRSSSAASGQSWRQEALQNELIAHNNNEKAQRNVVASQSIQNPAYQTSVAGSQPATERRIAQLQGRLIELETVVYAAGGKPTSQEMNLGYLNPIGPGAQGDRNYYSDKYQVAEQDKALLRGKSFKTQYFGPSSTLAILLQFEDLSTFVKEILIALPSLSNAKHAMSKLRQREKQATKQAYDISLEGLINLIPEKSHADKLLFHYLEFVETVFRIVHVPSFLKDYEAYWKTPSDAKPQFIVQLLVAMAMMICIVPGGEEGFVGRSSAKREVAAHWINIAAYWFENQSQKHVSLVNYQLHIQIWLARAFNTIKVKRYWTDSGALVRKFMSAGLHREPSLLCGKINQFDCEMRRRLWYTVLEIDLQCTIDRGFTPTLGPMDWDTNPPLNIDDEDFDIDSEKLPEPKPRGTFTRTSYLSWAAETLPLRIEVLYKINSIRNALDHNVIMEYDQRFRECMDDIPIEEWTKAAKSSNELRAYPASNITTPAVDSSTESTSTETRLSSSKPSSIIAIVLAQNIFNEFLTVLHQPFPAEATFRSTHFHSRVARRYACMSTIRLLRPPISIEQAGAESLPTLFLDEIQRRFFAFFRDDHVRAALSIAHSYVVSASTRSAGWLQQVGDDHSIIALIQAVVDMLGDRILNLGQGFHGYWTTSSALSFVHSKQSPNVSRAFFSRSAADRVVQLHSKVMDGQLPRARRLLLPTGDPLAPTPSTSLDEGPLGSSHDGVRINAASVAETIQSLDGAIEWQDGAAPGTQNKTNLYGMANNNSSGLMNFGVGGGAMIEFDGGIGSFGDPMQDSLLNFDNLDWDQIMNGVPGAFMFDGLDYAS